MVCHNHSQYVVTFNVCSVFAVKIIHSCDFKALYNNIKKNIFIYLEWYDSLHKLFSTSLVVAWTTRGVSTLGQNKPSYNSPLYKASTFVHCPVHTLQLPKPPYTSLIPKAKQRYKMIQNIFFLLLCKLEKNIAGSSAKT